MLIFLSPDTSDTVDTSVNRHRSDTASTLLRHAPTLLRHLRHLRHSDTSGLKEKLLAHGAQTKLHFQGLAALEIAERQGHAGVVAVLTAK